MRRKLVRNLRFKRAVKQDFCVLTVPMFRVQCNYPSVRGILRTLVPEC